MKPNTYSVGSERKHHADERIESSSVCLNAVELLAQVATTQGPFDKSVVLHTDSHLRTGDVIPQIRRMPFPLGVVDSGTQDPAQRGAVFATAQYSKSSRLTP